MRKWMLLLLLSATAHAQVQYKKVNTLPPGSVAASYLTICDTTVITYSCTFAQIAGWLGSNMPNGVVLNSPVLTFPALGTPSSVNLANATNLPLTTGVSGILPQANGGTGTATPALVPGANVTITGTWPNQTISASGGGGGGSGTVNSSSAGYVAYYPSVGNAVSGIPTTGSGSAVLATNPAISSAAITTATIDATSTINCTGCTNVPGNAISSTIPYQYLPGSTVRYLNTSSSAISSTDNGNIANSIYPTPSTVTIPAIGTNGITPNAFQHGIYNSGTGGVSFVPTTSTINGYTQQNLGPGMGLFYFADSGTGYSGAGNYTGFTTNCSSGVGGFACYFNDPTSSANGGWWTLYSNNTSGVMCLGAVNDAFSANHNGICLYRQSDGLLVLNKIILGNGTDDPLVYSDGGYTGPGWSTSSTFGSFTIPSTGGYCVSATANTMDCGTDGVQSFRVDGNQNLQFYQETISQYVSGNSQYPAVAVTCTGCTFPADDTGTSLAGVAVTANNPSIANTGTNGLLVGGTVYLGGTVPTGFTANTPYYVVNCSGSCAPTATSFELSATSGGTPITPTSGGSPTVTKISGIYQHSGGMMAGWFTLPTTATYGTGAYIMTMTWPNYASPINPQGYKCSGGDESGGGSQLVQSGHAPKTATLTKSTAASSGDVMGYSCVGAGGP